MTSNRKKITRGGSPSHLSDATGGSIRPNNILQYTHMYSMMLSCVLTTFSIKRI